jgi:cation-transporting ATPase I
MSASALSVLLTLTGGRSAHSMRRMLGGSPVYAAAVAAMAEGAVAAVRTDRRTPPAPVLHTAWHALPADTVERRVDAAPRAAGELPSQGAPGAEAQTASDRLAAGLRRYAGAFAADLRDPLVPVLVLGAVASAVLGSTLDAALVAGVSVTNAAVSGAQRARAEAALGKLVARHVPLARLVTDDGKRTVPAGVLESGDLIEVRASDVVPADVRLLDAEGLEVDEATLTGESLPVAKSTEPAPAAALADRACMLYEGTTVVAGSGRAVVVATGDATQAGRAAATAGRRGAPVGVQARLRELTGLAMPLTGLSGLAVTLVSLARGAPLRSALSAGVAVAVAAVPEGLPLVATVAQVAAARRLARRGVVVRSSRTVEALGRLDVVCFDKTGTLTEGRLVLRRVAVRSPDGSWRQVSAESDDGREVLQVAAAASPPRTATVAHATDRAVLAAVEDVPDLDGDRVVELEFETSRGYAATVVRIDGGCILAVKGAPEVMLDRCRLDDDAGRQAQRAAAELARGGLRVLAVAKRDGAGIADADGNANKNKNGAAPIVDEHVRDLDLLGFVGLADTPRPSAAPALRKLVESGIRVTMVTGDHPDTAKAIAAEIGLPGAEAVVTGAELDRLDDDEHDRRVADARVFARISPEQKVRLVTALQRSGHVVAMTGDGTNDAAAIRAADVGIAVESRGTAAAQAAADLLLKDADVELLANALVEGRRMWQAVTDAVSVLVGGNAGEITFILLGTALGGVAPLNPRQLLLVNLLTDMAPAMALAVRSVAAADATAVEGSSSGRRWLTTTLRETLAVRGAATAAGATAAWGVARLTGAPQRASTVGLLALVGTQLGQTLTLAGRDPLVLCTALGSVAVLALIVQTPGVSALFGCRPVGPVGWATALTCASGATAGAWFYTANRSGDPGADEK